VHNGTTGVPQKKHPCEASSNEWADLSTQTYDIEPTNLTRRNIFCDAKWIKSTWSDVWKYLHQVFIQYTCSGQRSGDMGEWCSHEEQERWVRATFWKGGSSNTIVRYPTVMIYSIALMEQTDFKAIGRAMPNGAGVDNSIVEPDSATAQSKKKRKKRGQYKKKSNSPNNNNAMLQALQMGTQSEAQLSALRLILEYGSTSQKKKAMKQVKHVAHGKTDSQDNDSTADVEVKESSDEQSTASNDAAELIIHSSSSSE